MIQLHKPQVDKNLDLFIFSFLVSSLSPPPPLTFFRTPTFLPERLAQEQAWDPKAGIALKRR